MTLGPTVRRRCEPAHIGGCKFLRSTAQIGKEACQARVGSIVAFASKCLGCGASPRIEETHPRYFQRGDWNREGLVIHCCSVLFRQPGRRCTLNGRTSSQSASCHWGVPKSPFRIGSVDAVGRRRTSIDRRSFSRCFFAFAIVRPSGKSSDVRCDAKSGNQFRTLAATLRALRVDDPAEGVIQALKPEPRLVRYELNDFAWTAIKSMLPNKPRGVRRVWLRANKSAGPNPRSP